METLVEAKRETVESVEEAKDNFIVHMIAIGFAVKSLNKNDYTEAYGGGGATAARFDVPLGFALKVTPVVGETVVARAINVLERTNLTSEDSILINRMTFSLLHDGEVNLRLYSDNQIEFDWTADKLLSLLTSEVIETDGTQTREQWVYLGYDRGF